MASARVLNKWKSIYLYTSSVVDLDVVAVIIGTRACFYRSTRPMTIADLISNGFGCWWMLVDVGVCIL